MIPFLLAWVLALVAPLPAASPMAAQTPANGDVVHVIASFSILGDLVRQVGGDAVRVTTLIGPGTDAHTYDPAPADLVLLSEADVVFENGLGFEPWLDGFYESAQPPGARVVVSEGITPRAAGEDHDTGDGGAAPDEGDERGQFDPHIWHDVANAVVIVSNIRDALVAADPAHTSEFAANAAAAITRLEALDASIREQVATLPEERRKLVTSHDTFGYFADAY
ncbi:MAG: zinc ABC transporter substrate-binding protein, partial [Chloroflexota bacterium]|nr:zinc ABC transporter substrate-binding protein [Chloroflexota bacterium]